MMDRRGDVNLADRRSGIGIGCATNRFGIGLHCIDSPCSFSLTGWYTLKKIAEEGMTPARLPARPEYMPRTPPDPLSALSCSLADTLPRSA